ncbi:MAG: gluconate 2-dehydrogenase subunit 3 family protein [Verrucomicrobiota bacterium]|jgi:hypothetical protein
MEPIPSESPNRIDRRAAIKWMGAVVAAAAVSDQLLGAPKEPGAKAIPGAGKLIGTDPVLNKTYTPGELWPLTLTPAQRIAAVALIDLILPPDNPSSDKLASQLGVQDFVDEWISAPYENCAADKPIITSGLDWIDAEAGRRFQKKFTELDESQKCKIADDICGKTPVKKEFKGQQNFFSRFRSLAAGGYYTTPQGMKDVGYVGNVPSVDFAGPTPEALKHLGLA